VSVGLIVAAIVYALSWTGDADLGTQSAVEDTDSPTSPEPDVTEPSDTATGDGEALEVGDTHVGDNADITLLLTRKVRPPAGREPSSGKEWFGIRAQICMHAEALPSGEIRWSSWVVSDDAGASYTGRAAPWDDYPAEQLQTTSIQPGACSVGWVLIGVPQGAANQISTVGFAPGGDTAAEWQL